MRRALDFAARDRSREFPLPAPVGGINGLAPLAQVPPTDAILLDNWYQVENTLQIRKGYIEHSDTGQTGKYVSTLFSYNANGIKRLFAAVNGRIYDVTNSSDFFMKGGLSSDNWVSQPFAERLFLVNDSSSDGPLVFDGFTIADAGFSGTGLNPGALSFVTAFKSRLYFIESETLNLWYGALSGVTGTLTKFNLLGAGMGGGVRGGTLVAAGAITQDGGDGTDDLLVLFTDRGEAVVYQGDDPAAANWSLVGTFEVGEPLDRRAFVQAGADLLITTRRGVSPLTQTFPFGKNFAPPTLNDKLGDAFRNLLRRLTVLEGWQIEPYPRGNMILVNVPVGNDTWYQYVMNTHTNAWTRFKGQNGKCWHVFDNRLFFGGADGKVYEADRTYTDNGSTITAEAHLAPIAPHGHREASLKAVRPLLVGNVQPTVQLACGVDYGTPGDYATYGTRSFSGAPVWDVAVWDEATWNGTEVSYGEDWCLSQFGRAFQICMKVSSGGKLAWNETSIIFEPSTLI